MEEYFVAMLSLRLPKVSTQEDIQMNYSSTQFFSQHVLFLGIVKFYKRIYSIMNSYSTGWIEIIYFVVRSDFAP